MRADLALLARGLFESRARAQAAIKAGTVFCNGRKVTKSSEKIGDNCILTAKAAHPWVSRGGVKLDAALTKFSIDPSGLCCLDIGASTGGFTDVLLSRGAAHVYAIDVGTAQLNPKISSDHRVTVMEQTDARELTVGQFTRPIDLIVCDASFISATKVLGRPMTLAQAGARLVTLVKPQFELGRAALGKGGIIKDTDLANDAISIVSHWVEGQGWPVKAAMDSPIKGGSGNREFLLWAVKI